MKKLVVMFVLMIVALGAVLAATNDTLTITLSIDSTAPEFQMIGSLSSNSFDANTYLATESGTTLAYDGDPDEEDVKVYVQLNQSNASKFSTAGFDLSITASNFKYKNASNVEVTTEAAATAEVVSTTNVDHRTVTATPSNNVMNYTFVYDGYSVAISNVNVISFTWNTTEVELPYIEGNYYATVTLAYRVE